MATKEDLIKLLKEKVVTVKFKKKDDSIRKMVCTLSEDYLPDPEDVVEGQEKKKKKENPNTLPVWDLEKLAWRSFRVDSVVEYESNF
jgi:WYL_2, Sm-like SH3 beta-barrel fold